MIYGVVNLIFFSIFCCCTCYTSGTDQHMGRKSWGLPWGGTRPDRWMRVFVFETQSERLIFAIERWRSFALRGWQSVCQSSRRVEPLLPRGRKMKKVVGRATRGLKSTGDWERGDSIEWRQGRSLSPSNERKKSQNEDWTVGDRSTVSDGGSVGDSRWVVGDGELNRLGSCRPPLPILRCHCRAFLFRLTAPPINSRLY